MIEALLQGDGCIAARVVVGLQQEWWMNCGICDGWIVLCTLEVLHVRDGDIHGEGNVWSTYQRYKKSK